MAFEQFFGGKVVIERDLNQLVEVAWAGDQIREHFQLVPPRSLGGSYTWLISSSPSPDNALRVCRGCGTGFESKRVGAPGGWQAVTSVRRALCRMAMVAATD